MTSRQVLCAAACAALLAAATAQSAQAQINLTYACSPPLPHTAANCSGWHTSPVTVRWDWNQIEGDPVPPGSCQAQTFSSDTTGTVVSCEVSNGSETDKKTITLKVDATPPAVTGATPSRPPDHADWWTQPLGFAFSGSDATSGIASCDQVTYSGPDGAAAQVTGSCRDVAGNVGTASFPLKFDATPPSITDAAAAAGNASVVLSWRPSADVVRSEVTRTAAGAGSPVTLIFGGTTGSFKDAGLENGVPYHYSIRVLDDAGNSATATATAVPTLPPLATVSRPGAKPLPLLRWTRVRGARYYNVQLFKNGRKILSAWPGKTRLQLAKTWTFRGKKYRLRSGRYRWYVWPGFGARAAKHYGRLIKTATFTYKP